MRSRLYSIGKGLNYAVVIAAVCILVDVALLKSTYPWHFRADNADRYPYPYEMFRAKPGVGDNNADGFRGRLFRDDKSAVFKIAFYGGSTGYNGEPPIAQTLEAELTRLWGREVRVYNFSIISSNHRQHLHGVVENLLARDVDLIVFYGANNEIFQTRYYDPRPGYPYNFFYREETSALRKALLENSAFFALLNKVLDRRNIDTGMNLTPLVALRRKEGIWTEAWETRVLDSYVQTLRLAKAVAEAVPSRHCGKAVFLAFFQPMMYTVPADLRLLEKARARIKGLDYVIDVSDAYGRFGPAIFTDSVHVGQPARNWMGQTIAKTISQSDEIRSRCSTHFIPSPPARTKR